MNSNHHPRCNYIRHGKEYICTCADYAAQETWTPEPTNRDGSSFLIRSSAGQETGGNGLIVARGVSKDHAHVIASARELLAALRTMVDMHEKPWDYPTNGHHGKAVDAAIAAITKATSP